MRTGSAQTAAQSPQDKAAWDALDAETRARVGMVVAPHDFVIATTPQERRDWARCDRVLAQAADYRATCPVAPARRGSSRSAGASGNRQDADG
jgi:hypothetical protein